MKPGDQVNIAKSKKKALWATVLLRADLGGADDFLPHWWAIQGPRVLMLYEMPGGRIEVVMSCDWSRVSTKLQDSLTVAEVMES